MELIAFLTAPGVAPFSGVLAAVLAIFVGELLLTVLVGVGCSHVLQAVVDSHPFPHTSVTNWLFAKEVPLLFVLLTLVASFGVTGIAVQAGVVAITGVAPEHLQPSVWVYGFAALGAAGLGHGVGTLLAKMKFVNTTALKPDEFLGQVATLTSPEARKGYAGSARFVDQHGLTHYVMVEPAFEEVTFLEGDRVQLVAQVSVSLYHARKA